MPVFNCENSLIRALNSIEQSLDYFYSKCDNSSIYAEIIIVNDGSTDDTQDILKTFQSNKANYKFINNEHNLGIGVSRNKGVRESNGEIIFFCDGDDIYLKEHILACYNALDYSPESQYKTMLDYSHLVKASDGLVTSMPFGAVKTKVLVQDKIHSYWQKVINNCHSLNLCVRRECHDFIEGFPEDSVYIELQQDEDTVYNQKLAHFFRFCRLDIATVQYFRYPGNCLDRQIDKFQVDPKSYNEVLSSYQSSLRILADKIYTNKLQDLTKKFEDLVNHSYMYNFIGLI